MLRGPEDIHTLICMNCVNQDVSYITMTRNGDKGS